MSEDNIKDFGTRPSSKIDYSRLRGLIAKSNISYIPQASNTSTNTDIEHLVTPPGNVQVEDNDSVTVHGVEHQGLAYQKAEPQPELRAWSDFVDMYDKDSIRSRWDSIWAESPLDDGSYGFSLTDYADNKHMLPLLPKNPLAWPTADVGRRPAARSITGEWRRYKRETDFHNGGAVQGLANLSPVEMLNHIGADFMSNKFDCMFMWDPKDDDSGKTYKDLNDLDDAVFHTPDLTDYEKSILSHRGFTVRLANISIPTVSQDTYDVPFLSTSIKKIRTKKNSVVNSSFTFRLDQDLVWLEAFQRLAGRTITSDEYTRKSDAKNPFVESTNMPTGGNSCDNFHYTMKTVAKTWGPLTPDVNKKGLCIIVKMLHLSNWFDIRVDRMKLPFFVFEDVRILGVGDPIMYTHDSADIQEVNVPFTFRRVYPVYLENEFKMLPGLVFNTDDFKPSIDDYPEGLARDWKGLKLASIDSYSAVYDIHRGRNKQT